MKKAHSLHVRVNRMARHFDSKVIHLAQMVCLCIGSPFSMRYLGHLLKGDLKAAVACQISSHDYSDPIEFRDDYLVANLIRKSVSLDFGLDREGAALSQFLEVEQQCAATCKRLGTRNVNGLYSRLTPESILEMARGKIARTLGPFSWDLAEPLFRFGPGATASSPHRQGDSYYKMKAKPSVTSGCAILAYTAIRRVPRWYNHVVHLAGLDPDEIESMPILDKVSALFDIIPGNRVTFVPKDAEKCRTIAIEPLMNSYIQQGIGRLIRRRFRRLSLGDASHTGLDLDDQSLNQRLAESSSVDGTLATLDLSSASDSVSIELVRRLLPSDWVLAIEQTRSSCGTLPDGTVVQYHKVSSMGNGYTFELESLIFWALCRSCVDLLGLSDRRVAVYGDDIVVPVDAVPTIRWMLSYWGFSLNVAKSFWSGPFRESCGKHYFSGTDVTPIYIRKDIDSVPRLFWYCNQIRRWSRLSWGLDGRMQPAYDLGVSFIPRSLRSLSIPDGVGDYALIRDLDEAVPSRCRHFIDAWVCKVWVPVVPSWRPTDDPFLLRQLSDQSKHVTDYRDVLKTVGADSWKRARFASDPNGVSLLGRERWLFVKTTVANWPSFGPWLGT